MSSYLDKHKAKLNITGITIGEAQFNSTANFINSTFKDSPFYKIVKINGADVEVRVSDVTSTVRGSNIEPVRFSSKYLHFRPYVKVNIGDSVDYDGREWLITDFQINDLYPTAKMGQCNNTLTYQIGVTKVKTGVDAMNRPVYTDTPIYDTKPCIIDTRIDGVTLNQPINLPAGQISITLQYDTNSKLIKENDELALYERKYKVIGIDFSHLINNVGLITVVAERIV